MDNKKTIKQIIKRQPYLVAGLFLAVMLIVVLGPVMGKLRSLKKEQVKLQEEFNILSKKRAILEGIDTGLADRRVERMEAVFPSKKPIVALMANLTRLAEESNMTFSGVTLSPGSLKKDEAKKKTDTDLRDMSFSFSVNGSFEDFKLFMKSLENAAPLMMIESVNLGIETTPLLLPGEVVISADVNVLAFYQSPPEKIGSVTSEVAVLSAREEALLDQLFNFKVGRQVVSEAPTGKQNLFYQDQMEVELVEVQESEE